MTAFNIGLLFYLTGCIISYALAMAAIKKFDEIKEEIYPYEPRFISLIGSLFSWVTAVYFILGFLIVAYYTVIEKDDNDHPKQP